MKLIFIRHAEPDYENNTLTEKGFKEADYLGQYYKDYTFDEIYVSPLNRAKYTLDGILKYNKKINKDKIHCYDWLQEFLYTWDQLPNYFENDDLFFDRNHFLEQEKLNNSAIKDRYIKATNGLDNILKEHGYERNGRVYKVNSANEKTLLFVCHLGLNNVLLSHLINIPYLILCQSFFLAPSSVTFLQSEEREKGIAAFRIHRYGDVNHLLIKNEPISKSGSFCEMYINDKERH